ncbi:heterokaryon incompatibility protein-domain-containing protein [Pestalotiopsis sp. NC0098]|nr:heterokaryon incompatibility protein-domain-containing protein [Pestalotiopsis sp. NC0098]
MGTNPRPWSIRSGSTFSEETVDKIKTWRKTCADTHKDCKVRREATKEESLEAQWLPTRLVEIITPDQDDYYPSRKTACRIVETKSDNIPTPLEYITLSHRWNEYNVKILERDKLRQWKIEIPLKVSKTFRDAFKVAQKLGISYIWIDSLCIIQGEEDLKDWKIEAPQMDKVYANAEFNICASLGDNTEGLFPPQERVAANSPMSEIWIAPDNSDNDDQDWGYDDYDPSGSFLVSKYTPGAMWEQSIAMSPLKDRGWVFQEQLLSFANLHFCPNEVLFECLQMRASESLGMDKDYPVNFCDRDFVAFKSQLPREQGSLDSADEYYEDPPDIYQQWYSLLSTYSARQLTYHKDRLIALSAVARYVKGVIPDGDIYIAGLWCSRLATDMLWRRPETSVVTEDDNWALWRERSPDLSFSWLSISGEIEQPVPDPENITDKAKVECILKGSKDQPFVEDLFSVEGPTPIEMKVTGHLRQISLQPQSRMDNKKLILVFSEKTSLLSTVGKDAFNLAPHADTARQASRAFYFPVPARLTPGAEKNQGDVRCAGPGSLGGLAALP